MNLIQKLAGIRGIADSVKKNLKGYNYSYADITEILAKVTSGMKKYGVSLIPSIVPGTSVIEQHDFVNTKTDKAGNTYDARSSEMLYMAEMVFRWVNDDDPLDFIDVPWYVVGMQADPSQALGSGMTYTLRQFLTNYFQIAQSNLDVDAYRSKQKAAADAEDKAITSAIIEQFDTLLRTYLADHPDKSEEIQGFLARFAKKGNYFAITDPELAAKLLNNFKTKYIEGKK